MAYAFLTGLLILTILVPPASVGAATFVVNDGGDVADGACDPAPGGCSLRDAISAANAAGGTDTIVFDSTVFPPEAAVTIMLVTGLPVMLDPAGTFVDGSGAGVVIDGSALGGGEHGLAIESGAGVPLTKAGVTGVSVQHMPGDGVRICGGASPGCDDDVVGALVAAVRANDNGENGVRIDGRQNVKARVFDSVAARNGSRGFNLNAADSIVGAQVRGCAALANDLTGLNINAGDDNTGSTVLNSSAIGNGGTGININAGQHTRKATLKAIDVSDNDGAGININAGDDNTAVKLTDISVDGCAGNGVNVNAGDAVGPTILKNVVSSRNDDHGVNVNAGDVNASFKMTGGAVVQNGGTGLNLNGGITVTKAKINGVRAGVNAGHGIRIAGTKNGLKRVMATHNAESGVRIDAGDGANKVERSHLMGNEIGIEVVTGSLGNKIQKNVAIDNSTADLVDGNAACDNTSWKANVFQTRNLACVQ